MSAIESAEADFEEGDVGAGKGTTCFGLKGGIGSASRIFQVGTECYTLGVLVQSNFGSTENLRIDGIVMATDLPASDRQLTRIIKRAGVGLARMGSYWGHGSGDIVIGFSTAQRIRTEERAGTVPFRMLNEEYIDTVFQAMADATEEAVLRSMLQADAVGKRRSLKEFLQK